MTDTEFITKIKKELPGMSQTEIEIALRHFHTGWSMNQIIDNLLFGDFCPDDLF